MPRATATPLAATIQEWVEAALIEAGYAAPARKRLALLLTGLVAGERATVSGLSRTLRQQRVSAAQEPSIARRLLRLLDEADFDPARLLPAVFRRYLPQLFAGLVAAHAANQGCPAAQHARFRPVRLVVDESSQTDAVHILVVGWWYQGVVLPLAVRVWPQNAPLPADAYWAALGSLCWEVHELLPAVLRDHVVLLADRGYGYARMIDLLSALGWGWVLRSTGQVRVRLAEDREQPLRALVPTPGRQWGCWGALAPEEGEPVALFRKAGWRSCHLVGVWLAGQAEPWLLLTNLPAEKQRLAEYAQRWAIERLFLCWKSHGWDLEAGRIRDPRRVGRLLSGLVLATWWRLACAQPAAAAELARLAGRRPAPQPRQLPLQFSDAVGDRRPWPAKFSLFTWGTRAIREVDCRRATPALDWSFADWTAPPWPARCLQAAQHAA
jgi:hypothetical protein